MTFLIYILAFAVLLGVLVTIHELGHFLAARFVGVFVEKFYIGFNAFGYGWILIVVAFFRELLGSGTVWGYPVMESIGLTSDIGYANNGMMVLPPMALITVGIIIWIQRMKNRKLIESK